MPDSSSTGKSWTPVAVNGCFFNLLPGPADAVYDLTPGRDWFNYCTTSVPDAQILLSDDMCLNFLLSPFSAVHPHHTCEATPQFCVLQDQEMADISDSLLSCDADVTGSSATLNDNTMDVGIKVLSDGEDIQCVSCSSMVMQSPTSALSSLLSMTEYATKPVLTDIAKHHKVQLPLETNWEVLHTLIIDNIMLFPERTQATM